MNRFTSKRGFTLIELMLAITILAIVMGIVFSSFASSRRAYEIVEGKSEVYQLGRAVLAQIADEINASYLFLDRGRITRGIFLSKNERMGEMDQDTLWFTSFGADTLTGAMVPGAAPEETQMAIEYSAIVGPDNDRLYLIRRLQPFMDVENFNPRPFNGDPTRFGQIAVIASETNPIDENLRYVLTGFNLMFRDGETLEWVEDWNVVEEVTAGRLPVAVEIQLVFEDRYGKQLVFATRTEIPMIPQATTTLTSQPGSSTSSTVPPGGTGGTGGTGGSGGSRTTGRVEPR